MVPNPITKTLESRVFPADEVAIVFPSNLKFTLKRLHGENAHWELKLLMPWGENYTLGKYKDEMESRTYFKKYDVAIREGRAIYVSNDGTAAITLGED